jgi:RNA polymerase-binding protein DksA
MNHERNIGRDSIDESMEEELFSTEMRLHDREKFLLGQDQQAVRPARGRVIDVCEDCGESISFRRLLARPVTTLCIDCKEQSEKEEAAIAQAGRGRRAGDGRRGGEGERAGAGAWKSKGSRDRRTPDSRPERRPDRRGAHGLFGAI